MRLFNYVTNKIHNLKKYGVNKLNTKQRHFDGLRAHLLEHFIGIDSEIDRIITLMRPWYLYPEMCDRPIIINLWGMTGVGKTDLIRHIIRYLSISDYVEKQMSDDSYGNLSGVLTSGSHGVVLLDEFQRFRHKDASGQVNKRLGFQDIWQILSDGCITKSKSDSMYYARRLLKNNDKKANADGTVTVTDWIDIAESMLSYFSIRDVNILNEIYKMENTEAKQWVSDFLDAQEDYQVLDYRKYLIFISGNLDSLYEMSTKVDDVSYPADYIYDTTKKLNILDVKKVLLQMYFPEHISRLGNNHIIYTSLNEDSFKKLIIKRLKFHTSKIKNVMSVDVTFDESINQMVYVNGVFPVQGVRPLYSMIDSFIYGDITRILIENRNRISKFHISCNKDVVSINDIQFMYKGEVDLQWDIFESDLNRVRLVSYHEAGHAIVTRMLKGVWPLYVLRGSSGGGATIGATGTSNGRLIAQITISYGGMLAEKMMGYFPEGHNADMADATKYATSLIRQLEYNDNVVGYRVSSSTNKSDEYLHVDVKSESAIEEVLRSCKHNAEAILNDPKNRVLLDLIAARLMTQRCVSQAEMLQIEKEM